MDFKTYRQHRCYCMRIFLFRSENEFQQFKQQSNINGIKREVFFENRSIKEIELAGYLTLLSFKNKTNIAKNVDIEFLLWFFGTKDIDNALKQAKSGRDKQKAIFYFADIEEITLKQKNRIDENNIQVLPSEQIILSNKFNPLKIEKISLSRI